MSEHLRKALDKVYLACIWLAGLALVTMALIIPWAVFTRYVLGKAASWPEPVAIICMMIFTFVGAAASYRAGAHIAVTVLTDRLPEAFKPVLGKVVDVLMLAVCAFILIWGFELSQITWQQTMPDLPGMRVGLTYATRPLGALLTMLFVIERLLFGSQAQREVCTYDHEKKQGV